MDTNTVRFNNENCCQTIPIECESLEAHSLKSELKSGTVVDGFVLVSVMKCTADSEVWFCTDNSEYPYVIKFCSIFQDFSIIQRITELECENLMRIIKYGEFLNYRYEIYPYYRFGTLSAGIELDVIRTKILPGIINGLDALHKSGIIHNDIKPSNIFWADNNTEIVIGDFGSACEENKQVKSLTPAYAAPELILGQGCGRASDWLSVGLTLASIFGGEELVKAMTTKQAENIWERGIRFETDDSEFRQLINGMLNVNVHRRLGPNAARKWCGSKVFGAEEHNTINGKEKENDIPIMRFSNPDQIVFDCNGLIDAFVSHWDYSAFLIEQHKIEQFLKCIDSEKYEICKSLRRECCGEDALYKLSLELSNGEAYVWRGRKYKNLLGMETTWTSNQTGREDIETFIQRGHVSYYCVKRCVNTNPEKMRSIMEIQKMCKHYPQDACSRFFQQLRGDDGVYIDGRVLRSLDDLVEWLIDNKEDLDGAVDALFENKRFEAWFMYQGMENTMEIIRRKCAL